MTYTQSIETCFGRSGLEKADFQAVRQQALSALKELRLEETAGKLPILSICRQNNDLAEINSFAQHIHENFDDLVIFGTGGSSLCGHVLSGFAENPFKARKTKVTFIPNIDPVTFINFFDSLNVKRTAFLTISKSGNSIETITQLMTVLQAVKGIDIAKHFFSLSMKGDNPLRRISAKNKIKVYDHEDVSGRFSIFSNVGLMPGAVAGINASDVRKGAVEFLENYGELAADSAALNVSFMRNDIWLNVLMTYPDQLLDLNMWHRQIWAESLGKNGSGSTPIRAVGTLDQHSQMQLYIAGRKDKFYNFITLKNKTERFKLNEVDPEFDYMKGKSIADLINAEQQATIDTLVNNGRPVRVIALETLAEREMGMLIAHMIMETIITAKLLGVNPFDQPAVEEGKIKTKAALKN